MTLWSTSCASMRTAPTPPPAPTSPPAGPSQHPYELLQYPLPSVPCPNPSRARDACAAPAPAQCRPGPEVTLERGGGRGGLAPQHRMPLHRPGWWADGVPLHVLKLREMYIDLVGVTLKGKDIDSKLREGTRRSTCWAHAAAGPSPLQQKQGQRQAGQQLDLAALTLACAVSFARDLLSADGAFSRSGGFGSQPHATSYPSSLSSFSSHSTSLCSITRFQNPGRLLLCHAVLPPDHNRTCSSTGTMEVTHVDRAVGLFYNHVNFFHALMRELMPSLSSPSRPSWRRFLHAHRHEEQ